MKRILSILFLFVCGYSFAQFQDDFSDGDFTNNPTWSGHDSIFAISSGQLQSQRNGALNYYLSTPSTVASIAQWEFFTDLQFATSGSNYIDVYLMSDVADLTAVNNGYFVRIGNTSDGVTLYEMVSGTPNILIDVPGIVNSSSSNQFKIKVTRDASDNWDLSYDDGAIGSYVSAGTIVNSNVNSSAFFGVYIKQSSAASPVNGHFFDDFYIGSIPSDTVPPIVDSIIIQNNSDIDVYFSEDIDVTSGTDLTNYFIDNAQENPTSATIDIADSSLVHLSFPTAFMNGQTDSLFVTLVEDRNSNVMADTTIPFFYFSSAPASYKDVVFNEIFADPSPQVYLPSTEFVEIYNASSNIYDLSGWQFVNTTTAKTFPSFLLYPDSFVIVCAIGDTTNYSPYGDVIGFSSWTALSNGGDSLTLLDDLGTVIDIVSYDVSWYNDAVKDDGGWTLELINPNTPCGATATNWSASVDTTGGTPGEENSIYNTAADVTAPELSSLTIDNDSTITLYFNEVMDSSSLAGGMYSFTGGLSLDLVSTISGNFMNVTLVLTTSIDTGTFYSVTVNGVADCPGNVIGSANSLQFVIGSEPQLGEVIINEIFADPTPVVGLPEAEFVELYNTTSKLIELDDCDFDAVNIPSGSILPNDYAIICSINDTALFSGYNNVIGIASFPTLTNGGELLTFENAQGQLVDEVEYDISWYQDGSKDDGGWSLELINPTTSCSFESNWIASNDASGGTPGAQNSVYDITPDTQDPNLTSVFVTDSNSVSLTFNEPMDSVSLATATYAISGGLSVSSVSVGAFPFTGVDLILNTNIDTAVTYTVLVTNATDCPGNSLGNNTGAFVIGFPASPNGIVINEIMCDPTPSVALPEKEFVEIYNTTTQLIDLSGTFLDGEELPSNSFIQPNGYVILCSINDTDEFNNFGAVVPLQSFPSLTNSGMLLQLVSAQGQIIDEIEYTDHWYNDPSKDDGGWSLEKKNPTAICNGSTNWAAANNFLGGTPGNQNSIYSSTPDQAFPYVVGVNVNGAQAITLAFSEPMDSSSLVNGTYSISGGVNVFSATTLGTPFDSVFLFLSNSVDTGITYTVTISGVTDCPGNSIGTPNTIDFILAPTPVFGDVVINEIFPDPSPVVGLPDQEFVELFNTTNKVINLSGCEFEGFNIPNGSYIAANGFVILCEDEDTSLFSGYGTVIGLSSWPSLTNGGESLELETLNGQLIDQVTYSGDWYRSSEKDDGGWTLEKVNPYAECNFDNNWMASENPSGGTPGAQNSVYSLAADTIAPSLENVFVISETQIQAVFNEGMNFTSLVAGIYSINNNITVDSITLDSSNYYAVTLYISSISTGTIYTLTVENVTDCPGNLIGDMNSEDFVLPELGQPGDLIINEVLFNPADGGEDFVEIYNNSTRFIDISNWSLANYDFVEDTIDNIKIIGGNQRILYPKDYALITKDTATTYENYPLSNRKAFVQVASTPTYSNDDGVVILITQHDSVSDRFDYDADMHFPLLTDEDGVSLERIDFDRETNDYTNWHSAAENVGFATPGYENSQYQPTEEVDEIVSVDPEIFSPDQDGYNDVLNISYSLDGPGYVGTILIYDAKGRLVRTLMNNELLSPEGTMSWDGTNDENEKSRVGIYIIYFSAYNTSGTVVKDKVTCVLATQL